MIQVPDPAWKTNPDIVADESAAERYLDDCSIPDEDGRDDEEEAADEAPAESLALIEVRQLPVIAERLKTVKAQVEAMTKEAASLVCTADTVQAVKTRRADLRKQFDDLEKQRKAAKAAVMAPYDDFERVYRDCISVPFKEADAALKATIDSFEAELKERCRADLQGYFDELCTVHGVDFLDMPTAMSIGKIKISMADAQAKTPRKLQDALSEVVARVATGMDQISRMDDSAEIMDEYKRCFDVGHAVDTARGRQQRIEAEKEAAEARKASQAAQDAAQAKVDALAPPVTETAPHDAQAPEEELFDVAFTLVGVTAAQARRVKEFLIMEGISYE